MVKARDAYIAVREQLAQAGIPDAGFDADALFAHVAGASRFAVQDISDDSWSRLQVLAARRAEREPLQYILGRWSFLDLELVVGPGVLVPRSETEEVCQYAADVLRSSGTLRPRILDLCSGTGALALGLQSSFPDADITAVELYPEALTFLQVNIQAYATAWPKVPHWIQADALSYYKQLPAGSLDMIVSNPPYVTANEYESLEAEVLAEPRTALVAQEHGLAFYHAFAKAYGPALAPGGHMVLEIGAEQGPSLRQILTENGWQQVRIVQDMSGRDRIAAALRPRDL